ncbi:MAG: FAD-binding oxidoreductase [Haloarculaceae archaeon]
MARPFDTVVVGAGIAGCMAARELASDRRLLVLDRDGIAGAATGRSAGLVAPTLFFGDLPQVARHANHFVREFDGTGAFEFTPRNRVDLVTADGRPEAEETAERRAAEGFPVSYLDAGVVRGRYPALTMDGFVGAVVGVATSTGTYRADEVVAAAGWRTRRLLLDRLDLPVRPYRTQCVVLDPGKPLDRSFPLVRVASEHLYVRPEHDGDLLVGGMAEPTDDPEGASTTADEPFRNRCAAVVPELFHGFERAGIVTDWAGVDAATPDAATPDARPVVDAPREGPEGLIVAPGFNGLGVMLSPIVGPAVRELLGGGHAGFPLRPFSLGRFDSSGADFALTSTSDV